MESETRALFGRRQIFTDTEEITAENVVAVLEKALRVHSQNQDEIQYLWNYYKGDTPIRQKEKETRPSINHKICVNRAAEIVTFKKGYGFGEPIQYIRRGQDEALSDDINRLNEYMSLAGKQASDSRLAEWLYVCGLGMRMVLPGEDAEEPFVIYTLDLRYSFIVRYNGLGETPVLGVKTIQKGDGAKVYSVYTRDRYFEIEGNNIKKEQAHVLGDVPLFEYPANLARLGEFEIVLPLLDSIDSIAYDEVSDGWGGFILQCSGVMSNAYFVTDITEVTGTLTFYYMMLRDINGRNQNRDGNPEAWVIGLDMSDDNVTEINYHMEESIPVNHVAGQNITTVQFGGQELANKTKTTVSGKVFYENDDYVIKDAELVSAG